MWNVNQNFWTTTKKCQINAFCFSPVKGHNALIIIM